MSAVDITSQTNLIDTPQEEGAKNVVGANVFGTDPNTYKEHHAAFKPVEDQMSLPATASPTVARNIASSDQHAAAIAPDSGVYSSIENWFTDVGNRFNNKVGPEQQLADLAWKKLTSDKTDPKKTFTDDDAIEMMGLQQSQQSNFGKPPSKLGFWTGSATDLAADTTNMVRKNAGIIAAASGLGAAIEGGIGLGVGGIGAIPGAAVGAVQGGVAGIAAAGLNDSYMKTAGSTYLALDQMKNADGSPQSIDESTKRALSHGVGIISGAIQYGVDKVMLGKLPYLQKLINPETAASYVMAPANAGLRNAILKIGSTMATGGIGSGAQAVASILGKSIGATYKDGEVSFTNGLMNAAKDIGTNREGAGSEVLSATGTGAVAGGLLGAAHEIIGHVATAGARSVRDAIRPTVSEGVRDVTPDVNHQITGGHTSDIIDVPDDSPQGPKTPAQRAAEVLHFQDVMNASSDVAQETKLHKIAPLISNDLRTQIAKSAGIDNVYVDRESLEDFVGTNEEKRAAVLSAIGDTDASKLNAPVKLPISEALDLHDQFPDFSDHIKLDPTGPSPNSAKAFVERMQTANDKRAELNQKLDLLETSPEDRAQNVKVVADTTNEDLVNQLGTKETARAYLNRLDRNEAALAHSDRQFVGKNGVTYTMKHNFVEVNGKPQGESITAFDPNENKVGAVNFPSEASKKVGEVGVHVEEAHRRQGIATALYDFAKSMGKNVGDSEINFNGVPISEVEWRSDDGKAFHRARGLGGKTQFVNSNSQQLENIARVRNRVEAMVEHLPDDTSVKSVLKRAMPADEPSHDVFGEDDYLAQSEQTKSMLKDIFPEGELERHTERDLASKKAVVAGIDEAAAHEMNKVADVYEVIEREARADQEYEALLNNPRVNIVERFRNGGAFKTTARFNSEADLTASHAKQGYSPFAIDPRLMSETQRNSYLDDGALKHHKTFVKGGVSPDDAATMLGVRDGDTLLKILSETPSREQITANRVANQADSIRQAALDAADLNHTAIAEAYHDKTKNDLTVMKRMVEKSHKQTLNSVARVAGDVPRVEDLKAQAQKATGQTTVGDLNSNQFKVGARKSRRLAVQQWIKGDFVNSAENQRKAALNNELAIAHMQATAEVNRAIKIAKRFQDKETKQELKDAGRSFVKAANELLDLFNLDPNQKNQSIRGSYQKWVKQQYEAGKGNFEINPALSDVQQSLKDMTVDQVKVVGQRLKMILHSAKYQNVIEEQYGVNAQAALTREALVDKIDRHLRTNPRFDVKRSVNPVKEQTDTQKHGSFLANSFNAIRNIEHIMLDLDGGKHGGLMNETIMGRIKGIGKYSEYGESNLTKRQAATGKAFEKIVADTIGKDVLSKMRNKDVYVPEFEGNDKISPNLSEAKLFMMKMNTGNDGNFDALAEGYGTDRETIQKILDRELTVKHSEMAQKIFDLFESHFPDVRSLKMKMEGVDPTFVQPITMKHGEIEFKGGYYTLRYDNEPSLEETKRRVQGLVEAAAGTTQPRIADSFSADEMTQHGHDMERVGSGGRPVSLDMDTIGQNMYRIHHDLAYRLPLSDVVNILADPKVSKGIASIEGIQALNQAIYSVVELAQPASQQNALTASTSRLDRIYQGVLQTAKTATLAYKPLIMVKHLSNGVFTTKAMGINGGKMLVHTATQMLAHPTLIKGFYEMAGDINPAIRDHANGIDGAAKDLISQQMPTRDRFKGVQPIRHMAEMVNDTARAIIGNIDTFNKVLFTTSAYSNFIAGNVEGFDRAKLKTMTPAEVDHQAKIYATNVVRTTLPSAYRIDSAPIQQEPKFKAFVTFIGPVRNTIANVAREGRNFSDDIKTTARLAGEGDYKGASKNGLKTGTKVVASILAMTLAKMLSDLTSHRETPLDDDEQSASSWAKYALLSGPMLLLEHAPYLSAATYAFEQQQRAKDQGRKPPDVKITTYGTKIGVDLINTANGFIDLYNGEELSTKERNSMVATGTYAAGVALPVDMMMKGYDWLTDHSPEVLNAPLVTSVTDRIDKFLKHQDDVKPSEQINDETRKALEDIRSQFAQPPTSGAANDVQIPDGVVDKIKSIESGGNVFAKNENSSAAGLYQFTTETWNKIKSEAPELGLTTGGRVAENPEQQEKAMQWFTKDNISKLQAANIPVTEQNIYAAHFLGAEQAITVLQAPAQDKLKTLVGPEVMAANNFRNGMKVREFKNWLSEKLNSAGTEQTAMLDNKK